MKQPEGFVSPGQKQLVCKLKKSLYGLKQAPRCWNNILDEFLKSIGFNQSQADQCVYVYRDKSVTTIIAVYVDDLVIMSNSKTAIAEVKQTLSSRFHMKDLGEMTYCLGILVTREGNTLKLSQKRYVDQMLQKFGMSDCNPVSTPAAIDVKLVKSDGSKSVNQRSYQSLIGSLLYLAIATRPDIAYSVGVLSRFNSCPTQTHFTAAKRILRYLKGTSNCGLIYGEVKQSMVGYCDASWGDNSEDRHSTTGITFFNAGGPISWFSKRQSTIALSTAESEYIALCEAAKEAVWLRQLVKDIDGHSTEPITINIDNMSADAIANNSKSSKRIKHIDIKYHYVREAIANKYITTNHCSSENMIADICTKPLPRQRFETLRELLRIKC
jgi:hypothetical protein